jgi:predicted Zn-dependent peptidase
MFDIDVTVKPGEDLEKVEKAIDEEVARLQTQGVETEELDERKATMELAKLSQLQSVESVADKLNEYEYVWGEPNSFKKDLDRYRNATGVKVQWWAKKVLNLGERAIVRVLPEEPEHAASARDQRPADLPSGRSIRHRRRRSRFRAACR